MWKKHSVAVVIPAYNVERQLLRVLDKLPAWVDHAIVVNDASQDATATIARKHLRAGLVLCEHAQNQGVGAAISTGYREALARGADIAVVMAGDDQMDPADLPALLAPLVEGRADYTKGNRLAHPEARAMPWARRFGTYALARLTRPLSGFWGLEDSQCGYTAITRRALASLALGQLYPRYGYPNDLLVQLGARGLRAVDVPVRPVYADEVSGFRPLTVAPKIALVLARAGVLRLRYHASRRSARG